MRGFAFLFALFTLLLPAQTLDLSKPPLAGESRPYKPPVVFETKLPNGLTVTLAEDTRFPLVTAQLVFLAGDKRDPKDLPGLATSVATMLMQGTTTRTYQQIAEELDRLGGAMNASAAPDSLTVEASVIPENTAALLTLLSDVLRNPLFPSEELGIHKLVRKRALTAQHAQPAYVAGEEYWKLLFGDTPYAQVEPTAESIDKISRQALGEFYESLVVPNNAFLILVGKLPARAEILKAITDEFGSWQPRALPAYTAPKLPESKRRLVLIDRPGLDQADVRLGRITAPANDPLLLPETVGSIIEGSGPASRLFVDIQEKRGYARDVHTEVGILTNAGTFSTVMQVKNELAADAVQGVLENLDRMAKQPVEKQELTDAKSYATGVFLLGMETQRGLADKLAQIKIMNLPKNYLETYTTRINAVETDQIESAAKKYFAPDNDVIVVVGDASKIQKDLEKIGTFQVVEPEPAKPAK